MDTCTYVQDWDFIIINSILCCTPAMLLNIDEAIWLCNIHSKWFKSRKILSEQKLTDSSTAYLD